MDGRAFRILADDDDDRHKRGRNSVGMDILPSLQSVHSMVVYDRHTTSFLSKFPNLTELTLLDIGVSTKSDVEQALASLEKNLQHLQSLYLYHFRDCNMQVVLPSSLTKVTLNRLAGQKMMETLKKLPNLLQLQIKYMEMVKSVDLSVGAGEFSKLLVLELIENRIDSWEMMSGGMRSLWHLIIIMNTFNGNIQVPNPLWLLGDLEFGKMEMDTNVLANSIRNKLRELNYVKEEIIHQFESKWELTLKNGCKVYLSLSRKSMINFATKSSGTSPSPFATLLFSFSFSFWFCVSVLC